MYTLPKAQKGAPVQGTVSFKLLRPGAPSPNSPSPNPRLNFEQQASITCCRDFWKTAATSPFPHTYVNTNTCINICVYIYIHMYFYIYVQASGVSTPPTHQWYGLTGGPGTHGGLRGLLGPNLHLNPDPKALQNPEPRPETSMLYYRMANYSILLFSIVYYRMLQYAMV